MAFRLSSTGALMSTLPLEDGPDDQLLHVDVGGVEQAALLGGGQHRDRVGRARGAEVRALEGIDRDVDRVAALADLLADVQHGRLVALAFADHDGAVDVDGLHLLAHGVHRHLVGVLAVALAHGAGGRDGGPLHHPHELQKQVVAMHGCSCLALVGRQLDAPRLVLADSRGRSRPA